MSNCPRNNPGGLTGLLVGAALLLPVLVFSPWTFDSWELPKQVAAVLTLGLACLAAARSARGLPRSGLHLPAAALGLCGLAATLCSPAPALSLLGAYMHGGGLVRLLAGLTLYGLSAILGQAEGGFGTVAASIIGAGAIAALYGGLQHFGADPGGWDLSAAAGTEALRSRCFGTLASPSFLGPALGLCLPLAIATASRPEMRRVSRATTWAVAVVMSACLVWTYSRAGWLGGFGGSAITVLWLSHNVRPLLHGRRLLAAAVGCAVLGALVGCALPGARGAGAASRRIGAITNPHDSAWVRPVLWRGASRMGLDRPLTGWGLDAFGYVFTRYAPPGTPLEQRYNVSSHSEMLDWLAAAGLPGVFCFLWLWGAAAHRLHDLARGPAEWRARLDHYHAAALAGGLAAYFVAVQFGFSSTPLYLTSWALLGYLSGLPAGTEEPAIPISRWIAAAIGIGWLAAAGFGIRFLLADASFQQCEANVQGGDARAAAKGAARAMRLDPWVEAYALQAGDLSSGDPRQQVQAYRAAVRAVPFSAPAHGCLAIALARAGRRTDALREWRAAETLDPQWPGVRPQRIHVSRQQTATGHWYPVEFPSR